MSKEKAGKNAEALRGFTYDLCRDLHELLDKTPAHDFATQGFRQQLAATVYYHALPLHSEVERLRGKRCPECNAELSYCGPMSEDGPTLDCKVCQFREEVEKLRGIVEKLPKTADGVPVVPGDIVYHPDGGHAFLPGCVGDAPIELMVRDGRWTTVGRCYSTPEAAQSATDTPT